MSLKTTIPFDCSQCAIDPLQIMSKYILTAQAKLDLREIKNYIGRNDLTAVKWLSRS